MTSKWSHYSTRSLREILGWLRAGRFVSEQTRTALLPEIEAELARRP